MNGILKLFSIAGKIDLQGGKEAERSIDSIDGKAKGLGGRIGGAAKKVGKAGLLIGGALAGAGTAAFAMTNKVTSGFDDIAKNSSKLGVTTDAYQEMDYWASQNGMSTGLMERAVGRLNQRIGRAADGNEKYSDALENLGINMDDVRDGTLSTEDAMQQSIQALSEMESSQERSAAASNLFGTKLARELMPALEDGAMSLDEAKEAAEELGIVIGEDTINAGVEFQDNLTDMKAMLSSVGQNIMAELIPVFNTFMEWIMDNMPTIQSIFETVFDIVGSVFSTLVGWIQSAIEWFNNFRESNTETFMHIWETIQEVFANIVEFLQESWENIQEFWQEHGQNLLDNAIEIFTNIWETVESVFTAVKDIIEQVIGYIVPWVQDKLAELQAFWEENGDKIMSAVENAFSFIQGVIEFIMPIITAIIEGAWAIIQSIFDTAIGIIMGLVDYFSSMLTGDFEGMKEAAIGIWETLWDGIEGIVAGAWDLLSGAFSALWDNISGWFTGLKDDAIEWGKGMIDGFIDGIKSMGRNVADAAKGVVSSAADYLKFWSPAKKGEGRFITHWGRNMIDGFLDGVKDEEDSAGQAMNTVVQRMNPVNTNDSTTHHAHNINNNTDLGEVKELLSELIKATRDTKDVYMDGSKVTDLVNGTNATATVGRYF